MAQGTRIARNTAYLTIASILQKVISLGYFAYLARAIGAENLGKYTFALTFTSIFIIFMDFGLGTLLTREVAKKEEELQHQFTRIFSVKIVLIIASLIVLFLSLGAVHMFFSHVTLEDVYLVSFASVIIIFDTIAFTFLSLFRSVKQIQWEALGIILYQGVILIVGLFVLRANLPLVFAIAAVLTGSVVQCGYLFILIKKRLHLQFHLTWNTQDVKQILTLAAPFALAGIVYRIYSSADSIMLKIMIDNDVLGRYALAYKLNFALTIVPGSFAISYFPVVSSHFQHAKQELHRIFEAGIFYMMLVSIPIIGGVLIVGDNIITSIWGAHWSTSIEPLSILMVGLPFVFCNYPIGNFLNAVNKQKINTLNMCIALLVNLLCNFLLIPSLEFNGAAISFVISSIVLVLLGIPWVYKTAPFRIGYIVKKGILIGISALIMSFILFFIQNTYPLLALIPLSVFLYCGTLLLTGALSIQELRQFFLAIIKRT